uniref:Uncharacterized protein n=1 Tax=Glossina brevipalpis TaxID=37001 RepID=A0A1A9W2L4_9MUSC
MSIKKVLDEHCNRVRLPFHLSLHNLIVISQEILLLLLLSLSLLSILPHFMHCKYMDERCYLISDECMNIHIARQAAKCCVGNASGFHWQSQGVICLMFGGYSFSIYICHFDVCLPAITYPNSNSWLAVWLFGCLVDFYPLIDSLSTTTNAIPGKCARKCNVLVLFVLPSRLFLTTNILITKIAKTSFEKTENRYPSIHAFSYCSVIITPELHGGWSEGAIP